MQTIRSSINDSLSIANVDDPPLSSNTTTSIIKESALFPVRGAKEGAQFLGDVFSFDDADVDDESGDDEEEEEEEEEEREGGGGAIRGGVGEGTEGRSGR